MRNYYITHEGQVFRPLIGENTDNYQPVFVLTPDELDAMLSEERAAHEPEQTINDESVHGPWNKDEQRYEDGCREHRGHDVGAPTPRSLNLLARALYLRAKHREPGMTHGSWWEALPEHERLRYQEDAVALFASPALDALVAERVAALAEDPAMVTVVRHELMGPGLPHPQAERIIRALAAALTERRPTND